MLTLPKDPASEPDAGESRHQPPEADDAYDDEAFAEESWQPDDERGREPLPAGDRRSWGAITAGTLLEGMPYPLPVFER